MNILLSFPRIRPLGASALMAALLFSASTSAQVIHYEWIGAVDNDWNKADNWNPGGVPAFGASGSDARPHTVSISGASVNLTGSALLAAAYDAANTGTYTALSLTDNATFQISGSFRIRSVQDTTRNMFIEAGSSFVSTSTGNAIRIGSMHSTITTVTVQGSIQAGTMIADQTPPNTFEGTPGGFVFDVDGGSLSFKETNFRFQGSNRHLESIGQFHIRNGGTASLGTIIRLDDPGYSNFYIDFVDGTGSLEFSSTGYSTLAAVEALIDGGKIRWGGNIVDSSIFSINSIDDGWQVGVIPEPSTYALMAGLVILSGAAFLKRRPQQN